jgi:hypothetical protein
LFGAPFSTEIVGTVVAAQGWLMAPIGSVPALWIWAYAPAWFVIEDTVKVMTVRLIRQGEHYMHHDKQSASSAAALWAQPIEPDLFLGSHM